MSDDYDRMDTADPDVVLLYRKGEVPLVPGAPLLKRLRAMARPGRSLFYARQAEHSAKARVKHRRKKFLSQFPVGEAAGCIVRYGKQWYRLIVTPKSAPTELASPFAMVEYAGEHLPLVARKVTVEFSATAYLQFAGKLHEKVRGLDWQVTDVDVKLDSLRRLVAQGDLPQLPDGLLVPGETPEPYVFARPVSNPHRVRDDSPRHVSTPQHSKKG